MTRFAVAITFALMGATAPVSAQVLVAVNTDKGQVLGAPKTNRTLYTNTQDGQNHSTCYDDCADAWPPYLADADAAPPVASNLEIIERRDGGRQWAKDGKPLYFSGRDTAPGQATGHGANGVWFAAQRDGRG